MADAKMYKEAEKRVQVKIRFFTHLFVYLLVNPLFILLSYYEHELFILFTVGWGIGLLIHGFRVFVTGARKQMIEKELVKIEKRNRGSAPKE